MGAREMMFPSLETVPAFLTELGVAFPKRGKALGSGTRLLCFNSGCVTLGKSYREVTGLL